jgi:anaerobic ribonucleoside-triphosphate reductase activating protein
LQIGGLTPLTSTDYPGCLSTVVFCQGCPWRCGYCHNSHLITRQADSQTEWSSVLNFLSRRKGLLDAVVFSGGEPTLQSGLSQAMTEVREQGFKIGLHTSGAYPSRLGKLLPMISWVGMDIKTTFSDYDKVTGTPLSGNKAKESAKMLLASGVSYEFRTTVHPLYHSGNSLLILAQELQELGVKNYVLQEFRPQGCNDETLKKYTQHELLSDDLCERIGAMFDHFSLRQN